MFSILDLHAVGVLFDGCPLDGQTKYQNGICLKYMCMKCDLKVYVVPPGHPSNNMTTMVDRCVEDLTHQLID